MWTFQNVKRQPPNHAFTLLISKHNQFSSHHGCYGPKMLQSIDGLSGQIIIVNNQVA
jgi:hypothetical protein